MEIFNPSDSNCSEEVRELCYKLGGVALLASAMEDLSPEPAEFECDVGAQIDRAGDPEKALAGGVDGFIDNWSLQEWPRAYLFNPHLLTVMAITERDTELPQPLHIQVGVLSVNVTRVCAAGPWQVHSVCFYNFWAKSKGKPIDPFEPVNRSDARRRDIAVCPTKLKLMLQRHSLPIDGIRYLPWVELFIHRQLCNTLVRFGECNVPQSPDLQAVRRFATIEEFRRSYNPWEQFDKWQNERFTNRTRVTSRLGSDRRIQLVDAASPHKKSGDVRGAKQKTRNRRK